MNREKIAILRAKEIQQSHIEESEERRRISMANNNTFPSFLDSTGPRGPQQQQNMNNGNGNGAGMNGMPMIAGQQMDVNFLYQMVMDLSEALKENREETAGIIAGAEELAVSTRCRRCSLGSIRYRTLCCYQWHSIYVAVR